MGVESNILVQFIKTPFSTRGIFVSVFAKSILKKNIEAVTP